MGGDGPFLLTALPPSVLAHIVTLLEQHYGVAHVCSAAAACRALRHAANETLAVSHALPQVSLCWGGSGRSRAPRAALLTDKGGGPGGSGGSGNSNSGSSSGSSSGSGSRVGGGSGSTCGGGGRATLRLTPGALGALLARCGALRALELVGPGIAMPEGELQLDRALGALRHAGWLARVSAAHNPVLSASAVQTLAALPRLEVLHLETCPRIGDGSALAAATSLRRLTLRWCQTITGYGLRGVVGRLEALDVAGCELVGDELLPLTDNHPAAAGANGAGGADSGADGSHESGLPHMQVLDISFTSITDGGLQAIAQLAPRLAAVKLASQAYNVWSCGRVSEAGVLRFRAARPGVRVERGVC